MLTIICILLALVALYCFGMWGYIAYRNWKQVRAFKQAYRDRRIELSAKLSAQLDTSERYTFHLGLCGIIALGFLGLILSMGMV